MQYSDFAISGLRRGWLQVFSGQLVISAPRRDCADPMQHLRDLQREIGGRIELSGPALVLTKADPAYMLACQMKS